MRKKFGCCFGRSAVRLDGPLRHSPSRAQHRTRARTDRRDRLRLLRRSPDGSRDKARTSSRGMRKRPVSRASRPCSTPTRPLDDPDSGLDPVAPAAVRAYPRCTPERRPYVVSRTDIMSGARGRVSSVLWKGGSSIRARDALFNSYNISSGISCGRVAGSLGMDDGRRAPPPPRTLAVVPPRRGLLFRGNTGQLHTCSRTRCSSCPTTTPRGRAAALGSVRSIELTDYKQARPRTRAEPYSPVRRAPRPRSC